MRSFLQRKVRIRVNGGYIEPLLLLKLALTFVVVVVVNLFVVVMRSSFVAVALDLYKIEKVVLLMYL